MFEAALDESGSLRALEFEPRWHYLSDYQADRRRASRDVLFGASGGPQQCQKAGVVTDAP